MAYRSALELYAGDLTIGYSIQHVIERERLRARYLSIYAHLADLHFEAGDYEQTLVNALRLLAYDPCREDAHRMAMRCYVRLGQRAQAMRQYRICAEVLALEYDARPEELTEELHLSFAEPRLEGFTALTETSSRLHQNLRCRPRESSRRDQRLVRAVPYNVSVIHRRRVGGVGVR